MSNSNYEWNETNTSLTITIPLSYKVDKRQIDYVITDSYVKLNIPEMKTFYFIDLFKEVDMNTSKIIIEENNHESGMKTINVSCQYTTTITKLDFPVTVSRIIESNCKNPTILRESDKREVNIRTISNKIIFDVIPGEKYQFTC